MMEGAHETRLGERRGAKKQFRYGNLHIREYDDEYVVHMDNADPRKDPLGHLLKDSPETLLGIASSIYFGRKVANDVFKRRKDKSGHALLEGVVAGGLASLVAGFLGYSFGKKIKKLK
jgi:hypothetical protein